MDLEKIKQILEAHAKWVRGEEGGERAILTNTSLSGADIQMAYGKNICSVSGRQGEEGRMITLLAEGYQSEWIFFCGCFRGTLAELKTWLKENRNGNSYEMKSTMLCVRFLLRLAKMKHS